jgi:hypothetical protein
MAAINEKLLGGKMARKHTYRNRDGVRTTWEIKMGQTMTKPQITDLLASGVYTKIFTAAGHCNLRRYPRGPEQAKAAIQEWEEEVFKDMVVIPLRYANDKSGDATVRGQLAEPVYGYIVPSQTYRVYVGSKKVSVIGSDIDVPARLGCPELLNCVREQMKKWEQFQSVATSGVVEGVQLWEDVGLDKNGLRLFESLSGTNRNETMHSHCLGFVKGDNLSKPKAVGRTREGNRRWNRKARIRKDIEVDIGHHDWWVAKQIHDCAALTNTVPSYPEHYRPTVTTPVGTHTCSGDVSEFIKSPFLFGLGGRHHQHQNQAAAQTPPSPQQTTMSMFLGGGGAATPDAAPITANTGTHPATQKKRKRAAATTKTNRRCSDCPADIKKKCACPDLLREGPGRRYHQLPIENGPAAGSRCEVYKWLNALPPYT